MTDLATRVADRIHQFLKRSEARLLAADYEELRLRRQRLAHDVTAGFDEHSFAVVPDISSIRTLLVFKPDEIGDAVHALPAIAELRRSMPDARLFLICRGLTEPLYARSGLFDEIATYEPGARVGPFRRRLRETLGALSVQEFDLGIFLRTYPATFREYLAVPCRERLHPLDPRLRSSSPYRPYVGVWDASRVHQALQMLQIVAPLTGREYDVADAVFPSVPWTDADRTAVDAVLGDSARPYVVLHPFAKDETRRYPGEYWDALLDGLSAEFDVTFVVIGASNDPTLPLQPDVIQAQGRLGLMETAYLLSNAAGFIGNLSGPAHLAAALGTPTFTLMSGHSLPAEWAPRGDASKIVRADVPCAPCHQRTCPVYGLACLRELTPARVLPELAEFLQPRVTPRLQRMPSTQV